MEDRRANLIPSQNLGNAMCFRDGVVWIAADKLYKSLDTGLTWTEVNNNIGMVHDVDFIDSLHGIISSVPKRILRRTEGIRSDHLASSLEHILDALVKIRSR